MKIISAVGFILFLLSGLALSLIYYNRHLEYKKEIDEFHWLYVACLVVGTVAWLGASIIAYRREQQPQSEECCGPAQPPDTCKDTPSGG